MFSSPRTAPLAVVLASALVLGTALLSQYGFGLEPCKLCLWQRWPYAAAIALGLGGALLAGHTVLRRGCLAACVLVFLAGAGVAGFHAGVEYGWWEGLRGCTVPGLEKGMTIEELQQMLNARERVVPCDEPAFVFLGLSMAGWNFLVSLGLAAASAYLAAGRRS